MEQSPQSLMRQQCLIDGQWQGEPSAPVTNPAAGSIIVIVHEQPVGGFFEPTAVIGANADMRLAMEETFGPVAPLFRFGREDDAIRFANATPYGLAAYFYSRDVARVFRVTEKLEFGIVGVNEGVISTGVALLGGLGREDSRRGVEEFLEMKYMFLGGLSD